MRKEETAINEESGHSYKQIFKSTSIVGGAQILNIIIGIVKTKVVAVLLGPSGVGIVGIFQTIIEMVRNATGFGVNFSGVKHVAEHAGDPTQVAKTILVLRRWEFGTGLIGTLVIIILCRFFSVYSFGNKTYTISIALMSVIVLINAVSAGQLAILQGLRKIGEMAKATLLGSAVGTVVSLPIFWFMGISGIVPAMVVTACCSLAVSWFFARHIITENVQLSITETFYEGLGMAKLGFFIVVNGFVAAVAMYIIRILIKSHLDIEYIGYFQSVWTISTLYIGVLLNAMLADYFPRLSMIKDDNHACNKLINEQLEITLLVGAPMFMLMIAAAPLALSVLYTSSFYSAIPILKWQMLASFFTLISWPLAVLYLSKNKGVYAIISETTRQTIYISVIYFCWKIWGFNVLGIGFLFANIFNAFFVYFTINKISDFKFSNVNIRNIIFLTPSIALTLYTSFNFSGILQYIISGTLILVTIGFCLFRLDSLIGIKAFLQKKKIIKSRS